MFNGEKKKGVTRLGLSNSLSPINSFYTPVAHFTLALPLGIPSKGRIVARLAAIGMACFHSNFIAKERYLTIFLPEDIRFQV